MQVRDPVRTRLITEFVNRREELMAQASRGEAQPEWVAMRLDELNRVLESLADKELPN